MRRLAFFVPRNRSPVPFHPGALKCFKQKDVATEGPAPDPIPASFEAAHTCIWPACRSMLNLSV